jgi:hypothetical protein
LARPRIIEKQIVFNVDKIYFTDPSSPTGKQEVMMSWEDSIMQASAAYVAGNGGNILEIGYGMGIASEYIQSYRPKSHTIVEIHPDIFTAATNWSKGKRGADIRLMNGDWYDLQKNIAKTGPYDGILYDGYSDPNSYEVVDFFLSVLNPQGGRFTLWNPLPYPFGKYDKLVGIANIDYDIIDLSKIQIPANYYFNHKQYYLPKIETYLK